MQKPVKWFSRDIYGDLRLKWVRKSAWSRSMIWYFSSVLVAYLGPELNSSYINPTETHTFLLIEWIQAFV